MYCVYSTLKRKDPQIFNIIQNELYRQKNTLCLIASENITSQAVMEAQGSVLTNKYAEGYSKRRYYAGCEYIDELESLTILRAKKLFSALYANVQPHSGSQANHAVYMALLKNNDTILAMSLKSGGHLTHGSCFNLSGRIFNCIFYNVDPNTYLIDFNEIEKLSTLYKPKLIIAGFSCYSQNLNFKNFKIIANKVGAYFMVDMSHIAGIVATNIHDSPLLFADIVTTTTQKTLRGPRGGIILSNNFDIMQKVNRAVFPGIQGGPAMHIIAAKAVTFNEAQTCTYKKYIKQMLLNAYVLCNTLKIRGYNILTGNTKNHMVIINLQNTCINGKLAVDALNSVNIVANHNLIPYDIRSVDTTSGVRLGSAALTSRGFKESEFLIIGNIIADVLDKLQKCTFNMNYRNSILNKIDQLINLYHIH